jgi:hypothetical protein
VVLEPPLLLAGLEAPVAVVEIVARETFLEPHVEPEVRYLDENFAAIANPAVLSYTRTPETATELQFQRGDTNSDGNLELTDVIFLLEYLFRRGEVPSCRKAADANDDGRLDIVDPIGILKYLFRNAAPLPEPFEECGLDITDDTLGCSASPTCQ